MSSRIDGAKVRFFASKSQAQEAARSIGWPVKCVVRVETRFQVGWALGMGVDLDPIGGSYLSRESFARLFQERNLPKVTRNDANPALGRLLAECAWVVSNDAEQLARYGKLTRDNGFDRLEERPMTPEVRAEVERLRVLGNRMAYAARREGVVDQGGDALWGGDEDGS